MNSCISLFFDNFNQSMLRGRTFSLQLLCIIQIHKLIMGMVLKQIVGGSEHMLRAKLTFSQESHGTTYWFSATYWNCDFVFSVMSCTLACFRCYSVYPWGLTFLFFIFFVWHRKYHKRMWTSQHDVHNPNV